MGARAGDAAGVGTSFVAPGNRPVNDAIRDSRIASETGSAAHARLWRARENPAPETDHSVNGQPGSDSVVRRCTSTCEPSAIKAETGSSVSGAINFSP